MDEALRSWVEAVSGAPVEASARSGTGSSRATWLLRVGGRGLVLRVDSGDGPVAGTELSLAREGQVYAGLAGTGVRIPRLVAVHPKGAALLMEQAPGAESLDGLDPALRRQVIADYLAELAALHRLDPRELPLAGLSPAGAPRPGEAGWDPARAELALWLRILDARVKRPAPLARFAFHWLARHAPPPPPRPVLCHGDVGPGNFLHAEGRVTALLDWEFAHVGDAMDDLAWWAFRGHHVTGDVGELAPQLAAWSRASGIAIEPRRIAWYRALVMLRWLVASLSALDSGARSLDRSVHFAVVAMIRALLPRALGELAGVAVAPPAPLAGESPAVLEVIASLSSELGEQLLPALADAAARKRALGMQLLLVHVAASARLEPAVARAEREELEAALGSAFPGAAEAERALADQLVASAPGDDARWIALLARRGLRRAQLWPILAPVLEKPFAPLEPA